MSSVDDFFVVLVVVTRRLFTALNNAPEGVNYSLHKKYNSALLHLHLKALCRVCPPVKGKLAAC